MLFAPIGFMFTTWLLVMGLDTAYAGVNMPTTALNAMAQFSIFREAQLDLLFLSFTFPVPNTAWFSALGDLLTWNQGLFEGWANWIRLSGPQALSVAIIATLVIVLFSAILTRR